MADSRLDVLAELTKRILRKKMNAKNIHNSEEYVAFVKGYTQRNDEITEIINQLLEEIKQGG